jgi:NADP-dependent 3-hydroxy acid dehydrogenase YdfG
LGELARELSYQSLSAHFLNVDLTDIAAVCAGVADARKVHGPVNILINTPPMMSGIRRKK